MLRAFLRRPPGAARGPLRRDPWFRRAWAVSVFLHVMLIVWVTPSQPKYRFFGSGTAVSLVGADEIPGGSARGKSGDRPEALREAARSAAKAAEEAAAKKAIKKKPAAKKARPRKKAVKPKKEAVRRIKAKADPKKKKKPDPERLARLQRIRERRERAEQWRKRFERNRAKKPVPRVAKKAPARGKPPAEAPPAEPPRPRAGYVGEGGGDGQGGGSLGGGSGGTARTDLERYYGLLAERIRSHWTVPEGFKSEGLRTEITIDVRRDGEVRNLRVTRPSGNRVYDEWALRAVERASTPAMPPAPNTVKDIWLYLGFRFCGRNFCK